MADQNRQDPYPLLSRVAAGPIRESFRLVWGQLGELGRRITPSLTAETSTLIKLGLSADISLGNGVFTDIPWSQLDQSQGVNTREVWTLGQAFPERLMFPRSLGTPGVPSLWQVTVMADYDTDPNGQRIIQCLFTDAKGTTLLGGVIQDTAGAGPTFQCVTLPLINPPGGSYLVIQVRQDCGGPLNLEADNTHVWLTRLL